MIGPDEITTIVASSLRLTAPLAFAACGEYLAERAGTQNISVEGMMLGGAFGSAATTVSPTAQISGCPGTPRSAATLMKRMSVI